MLTRPALSLNIKDLKDIEGQTVAENTHNVNIVTFIDKDGIKKRAYKKPCSPDYYPPLLAKYVVAFSTIVRAALGEKASEDRLVYNDAGEIVATLSIEVPKFVPLLTYLNKYDDPKKEKIGCPTKQMLIEENVAELLISAYKHKNNDLHPSNISIYGLIDWDELYYDRITSIIKGERTGSGLIFSSPKILCELKEQDLRIFPIVYRIHWPANYIPKNWNLTKVYKTGAFAELQGDKEFIYQYFTAILKELLAFDKNMLKERMNLSLGNENLSLNDLSQKKREALLSYEDNSTLFLNDQGTERGFVEHAILLLEKEHHKFRNLVLKLPEFKDFLIILNKHPAKILEIKEWFINQNKKNIIPYNLDFIDTELHNLWRECFKSKFTKRMEKFSDDINNVTKTSHFNVNVDRNYTISYEQLDAMITSFIKPNDIESKTAFFSTQERTPEETLALNNAVFSKIKIEATQLSENISRLINQYQEFKNATIEDNHAFIENVKKAIAANIKSRKQLDTWLRASALKSEELRIYVLKDRIYDMDVLFQYIDKFIKKMENTLDKFYLNPTIVQSLPPITNKNADNTNEIKVTPRSNGSFTPLAADAKNSSFFSLAKPFNMDDLHFIQTETTIIHHLSMHLKQWVTPDKNALIKTLIDDVYRNEYKAQNMFYCLFQNNGTEVYNKSLNDILSNPKSKWNASSFKTLLIKKLCFKLLEVEKYDPYIKSIYERIIQLEKNDSNWWSTVAQEIAEKSGLKKSLNERTIEKANAY